MNPNARVVPAVRVAACLLAVMTLLCAPACCCASTSVVSREVEEALALPDGAEAHICLALAQTVRLPWVWVHDTASCGGGRSRSCAVLPVYLNTAATVDRFASLRLRGRMCTAGGRRFLVATEAAEYVGKNGAAVPPPPLALASSWSTFRSLPIVSNAFAETPSVVAEEREGAAESFLPQTESGTVADAKVNGGEVSLSGVLVVACMDADGDVPGFFYVQDINLGSGAPRQIPCGIRVVPELQGVTESLKPGDIVNLTGTVIPSSSTVAEAYIEADTVTDTELDGTVPPYVGMANRSTAGGEFGEQQATYLRTPTATQEIGSGLNPTGTLARVWGRITRIDISREDITTGGIEHHVCYWLDDGSGLERTVIENNVPVVRTGLKVIAWADSTTPVRHLNDYVNLAGVIGAEFSEDSPALAVPVLRCGRLCARQIIHVDGDNGNDALYDGLSWQYPKATVQAGINVATSGGEVWVKAVSGGYEPRDEDDDAFVAHMKNGVCLYGGFDGAEDYRYERDRATNWTVFVGGNHVVMFDGLTVNTRVDGLALEGGTGGFDGWGVFGGGGVMFSGLNGSEGTLTRCVVMYNGAGGGMGAGIYSESSPCLIYGNYIYNNGPGDGAPLYGGGIYCHMAYLDVLHRPYIAKNTISGNNAEGAGGGIDLYHVSAMVRGNTISANTCNSDGGAISLSESDVQVLNNDITENETLDYGGAIYSEDSSVLVVGNVIEQNHADMRGGAMELRSSTAEVTGNTFVINGALIEGGAIGCTDGGSISITDNGFTGNSCGDDDEEGEGGAIYVNGPNVVIARNKFYSNHADIRGGAIGITDTSGTQIINNVFAVNDAADFGGGAIFQNNLSASLAQPTDYTTIVNNTFVENKALNGSGGAVAARGENELSMVDLTLVNNIFWKNRATDWDLTTSTGNSVACRQFTSGSLFYCCCLSEVCSSNTYHYLVATPVAGCYCGLIGSNDPPMFVNLYHLSSSGPWYTPIDLGHDRDVSPYDTVPLDDLDGLARPSGTYTDMGAYETQ